MDLNASSKKPAILTNGNSRAKPRERLGGRPFIKDTLRVTLLSIIGRGLGFLLPLVIAALYGFTGETDAFFFANGVILFLTFIFAGVVNSVIVPFVAEARGRGDDLGKFIGSIFTTLTCVIGLSGLVCMVAGYPLLKVVTGFSREQFQLVYYLFLETLPLMLLVAWSSLIGGVLNALHRFSHPQISIGGRSLVTILMIFLLQGSLGIHAIPIAYLIGEASQILYLYVGLIKSEGIVLRFSRPNKASLDFFKTASFQIAGVTMLAFNPMVDKAMASWLAAGSISLLEYAFKLFFIPATILGEGLFVVTLAYWAQQRYEGDSATLRSDVLRTVAWIGLAAAILGATLFVLRHEFTGIFYGWGSFPKARVSDLGGIFGMYILGLPAYLANVILGRALIVLKDTKSIAKVAFLKGVANVICNLLLLMLIGLKGIALSTTLVEYLGALGLYLYFNKTYEAKKSSA